MSAHSVCLGKTAKIFFERLATARGSKSCPSDHFEHKFRIRLYLAVESLTLAAGSERGVTFADEIDDFRGVQPLRMTDDGGVARQNKQLERPPRRVFQAGRERD